MASVASNSTSSSADMANVTSESASGSGSQLNVGAVVKTASSNAGDSCTWYAGSECLRPRSCADCLNVLVSSDSCAISPDGACVGSAEYATYVNSQAYFIPNYKYYPSSEYAYCASGDASCAQCVAKWSGESSASVSTSEVCTGQDGCICLAACEVTDRVVTVLNEEGCSDSDSSSSSGSHLSSTERVLVALAVGAAAGLFFYAMVWILRRYMAIVRGRELVARSVARAPRTGPQLNLNGWKSLQQKLVETERAQLSREPATAAQDDSVNESVVTETAAASVSVEVEASGPAIEVQSESPVLGTVLTAVSGPAVIVERGDAYRPPSPSLMNARH